jgi:DNA-binding transcriptional ArsR family regulator
MDLIRKILFHVEEHDNLQFNFGAYDEQTVSYHVRLLAEAGLLHAAALTTLDGTIVLQETGRTGLTWEGYEFLDAARDESRWNEAKSIVREKAGSITVGVLTQLLVQLMSRAIGL